MLLSPHILAGMLFGSFSDDVRLAPALGLASYFVLEFIPHWDPENFDRTAVKVIRYIDFCLAIIIFLVVSFLKQSSGNLITSGLLFDWRYILGGLSAAVPYFIFNLAPLAFRHINFFKQTGKIHKFLHYNDRSVWGVLIQVSVCVICLAVLFQLVDFPTWDRLRQELY